MKAVILAGGLGTRLDEETDVRPKPMVEIGGMPILWHIMKIYSHHGISDFVICLGYKGYIIKEYFANYFLHKSDVTIDLRTNTKLALQTDLDLEPWRVTLVDTGHDTQTGGRIKRVQKHIGNETFLLTYGDGVANIDINATIANHKKSGRHCTMTAVQPPGRFGAMAINSEGLVTKFEEKPVGDGAWINGGFFVCEPGIFNYIEDDKTIWERNPLRKLADDKQLNSYNHKGFWSPMDTLREKRDLEQLWNSGSAPWKMWK